MKARSKYGSSRGAYELCNADIFAFGSVSFIRKTHSLAKQGHCGMSSPRCADASDSVASDPVVAVLSKLIQSNASSS